MDEAQGLFEEPRHFVPPGHFYSPLVNPSEARQHLQRLEAQGPAPHLPGIRLEQSAMHALWVALLPLMRSAPFGAGHLPGLRYAYENPMFSWPDGLMLHAMIRHAAPKLYMEVGCGWSSACALDTIEQFLAPSHCEMVLIDPYPEIAEGLLGCTQVPHTLLRKPVQAIAPDLFSLLQAGDILFIDSTHVLRTGSDVCFELFEILPRLTSGVLVQLHDVFWPFEYPREWILQDQRNWNELYALRAFLTHNEHWDILMFNDYFSQVERATIEATHPAFLANRGGSLWLRRR